MLHSYRKKDHTNEDPKTSAIFENLMLLPDNVFWNVLRNSCYGGESLPRCAGVLLDYEFWCQWNSDGTGNSYYVEPDVFFRFEEFDVVIEAKYSEDKGQYEEQWMRELQAYHNEFEEEGKKVFLIAVGGNVSNKKEEKMDNVYKCSWHSLLVNVNKYKKELDQVRGISDYNVSARLRLLDNIILAFNINNIYDIKCFAPMKTRETYIAPESLERMSNFFK